MEFLVKIEPTTGVGGSPVALAIEVLEAYQKTFSYCLRLAAARHDADLARAEPPRLVINSARAGSLDFSIMADFEAGFMPVATEVGYYAWRLFEEASKVISLATKLFDKMGRPAEIQVLNSINTTIIKADDNSNVIITQQQPLDVARRCRRHIDDSGAAT